MINISRLMKIVIFEKN